MSDPDTPPLNDLLANFALGPAWARGGASKGDAARSKFQGRDNDDKQRSRDRRGGDRRDGDRRDGPPFKGKRPFKDRDGKAPFVHEDIPPAPGVRILIQPNPQAVHLIVKEIHQVARVYSLFDVAATLLAERSRCSATFEVGEGKPPLIKGKHDESLFLTREDALHHLWNSPLRDRYLEEQIHEVDPPSGNFQSVARCGLSGEWLGPPNFHTYQTQLRRIHRERFSHLPFEAYCAKVRTERGQEAIDAWLESTKRQTRWRLKGGDEEAWISDRQLAERALANHAFDDAFEETRSVQLPASVPVNHLSPSLRVSLKLAGGHARKHPAILIPAVCKAIESEHLPVFKRNGKLFTGPARPHALPADATLAPRPARMVEWIRANKPAKLEGLWRAVLPEGGTAPPAEYAADLFWLLQQGHILLFTDDTLVVQEPRDAHSPDQAAAARKPPGSGKSKAKKGKGTGPQQPVKTPEATATAQVPAAETDSEADAAEADAESLTADISDEEPDADDALQAPADETMTN